MELCLGTAQLGMEYGIVGGNKLTQDSAINILKKSFELGIDTYDTAPSYGNAEIILGDFLASNDQQNIKIISKYSGNDPRQIRQCLTQTLDNMKGYHLDGYLFHDANMLYNDNAIETMILLKDNGLVKNVGVSVYTPEDALYAAKQPWIDYIQIPYNALDQRLDKIDFFKTAKKSNKVIFARSALLQGLLTMSAGEVKNKLEFATEEMQKYIDIVAQYDITQLEAAIQYVKCNGDIDYMVFGVYSAEQLEEFSYIFNENINYAMIELLKDTFHSIDDKIISPNKWYED